MGKSSLIHPRWNNKHGAAFLAKIRFAGYVVIEREMAWGVRSRGFEDLAREVDIDARRSFLNGVVSAKFHGTGTGLSEGQNGMFSVRVRNVRRHLGMLFPLLLPTCLSVAQEYPVAEGKEIVVTAERFRTTPGETPRSIVVLDRDEIQHLPVSSMQEIFDYAAGIELRERGFAGVQGDLSIRGSSFEQVALFVDGVRLTDPQTGHHLLNLALDPEQIERIEIVRGPGSAYLGPGAFAGSIHIVTRRPGDEKGLRTNIAVGQFSSRRAAFTVAKRSGALSHALHASLHASDGYRENTDFERKLVHYDAEANLTGWELRATAAFVEKKFGANSFYSLRFPDQWENTRTAVAAIRMHRTDGRARIHYAYRRNEDVFLLDRKRPEWYRNRHLTQSHMVGLQLHGRGRLGARWLYADLAVHSLRSSNLGDHGRLETNAAAGQEIVLRPLKLYLSANAYFASGWPVQFSPALSLSYSLRREILLFASLQSGFRVPSYTELYYQDPGNAGNPNLQPERSWAGEIGVRRSAGRISTDAAFFVRRDRNLIDWVLGPEDRWYALNHAEVNANGVELSMDLGLSDLCPLVRTVRASYARLHLERAPLAGKSKYTYRHPTHQLIILSTAKIGRGGTMQVVLRNWQRYGEQQVTVVDLRAEYRRGTLTFWFVAQNLLRERYEDFPGIPAPGLWVNAGFTLLLPRI